MAMLRYPRFRFRPSQADALHLDLWLEGRNLLRDAGTYSYNTESAWLSYFPERPVTTRSSSMVAIRCPVSAVFFLATG